MRTISVSFSPVASIYSMITSLESISKQIKDEYTITKVRYEQMKLYLIMEDKERVKSESILPMFDIQDNQYSILMVGCGKKVKKTLLDFINRLYAKQVQSIHVIDVPDINIQENLLLFNIQPSNFQKHVNPFINGYREKKIKQHNTAANEESIKQNGRLLIIDFDNLINTCYYATAAALTQEELKKTNDGCYINAIGPFIQRLVKIIRNYGPTHLLFAADGKREDIFRRNLYAEYKANRDEEKPAALKQQVTLAEEILEIMNIPVFKVPGMEADDIIGCITKRFVDEQCGNVVILSNDKDLFQLLNPKVIQITKNDKEMSDVIFEEEYGFRAAQFVDYKAIVGESTDNIPGIKGIGKKAFPGLLNDFECLEEILLDLSKLEEKYKRYIKYFEKGKESGILSKKLAMLQCDIPPLNNVDLESLKMTVNKEAFKSKMQELEIDL